MNKNIFCQVGVLVQARAMNMTMAMIVVLVVLGGVTIEIMEAIFWRIRVRWGCLIYLKFKCFLARFLGWR